MVTEATLPLFLPKNIFRLKKGTVELVISKHSILIVLAKQTDLRF